MPAVYADYKSGERQMRKAGKAKGRGFSDEAAPAGWLRINVDTHELPGNARIYPGFVRYNWLRVHYEVGEWAHRHGRKSWKTMLPSESAARRVCNAGSALHGLVRLYDERYSRKHAEFLVACKNDDLAVKILAAEQGKRRKALLALRSKRPAELRNFIAAVRSYDKARAALDAAHAKGGSRARGSNDHGTQDQARRGTRQCPDCPEALGAICDPA